MAPLPLPLKFERAVTFFIIIIFLLERKVEAFVVVLTADC
jgi:hypothetical protein